MSTISNGKRYIEQLPIRTINFSDPTDKTRHDRLVELVERMLGMHKRLTDARVPHGRTILQQQIDSLVYELYGLTEEEIKMVEVAAGDSSVVVTL